MIDFSLTSQQADMKAQIEAFIADKVVPIETAFGPNQVDDALRRELNELAKQAGVFAPHVPREYGGMGLNHIDISIAFEAAGYSLLGPIAMHCAAPDEGNMNMLAQVASDPQKERFLRPLANGDMRSSFAMTEPHPGAGSDPSLMATTAVQDGNDYVINGQKWLITGADGAGFFIIMAASPNPDGGRNLATMFFADADTPGIEVERHVPTTDRTFTGGHGVVNFKDVRVPASDILGEFGKGFQYAQVRLAPARLTHCMRWLGAAKRTHDIALAYAKQRTAFSKPLIDHEGVGFMLADNEIDIHQCRMAIWHSAWLLDNGDEGGRTSSMTKVFCSERLDRIADRSQQIMGGLGVTHDTVVAQIATEVRAFRIYDGPSEVHRWSLAKKLARA